MTQRALRVLLIVPGATLPIATRTSPQLGIAYLAAVSEVRGDQVVVYDGDVEDVSLENVIREYQPELVGITANTTQIKGAWRDAGIIKDWRDVPVVLGGPHPSILPQESLEQGSVDVVARGEGEETWEALSDALIEHWIPDIPFRSPESGFFDDEEPFLRRLEGLSYRLPDGRISHNVTRPPVKDLSALPLPAYHLLKMDRYTNLQPTLDQVEGLSLPIMTSRGCPYRCSYCAQIMDRRWRMRSAEDVVREWQWLVEEQGAGEIGVLDDSFNINRQRVLDICDLLIEKKLNSVPWIMINGIRANLADQEVLGRMKAAGCIRVAFGVESGNQEILDSVIKKKLTLDQVRQAFEAAKSVGMETIGFFIIGMPGETEETMDETIRFACELDPVVANFSIATPFPGTEMYQTVLQDGRLLVEDYDDYVFFEGKARFEMGDLSADLVERKWKEAHRRFYLRPARVVNILTRKKTWLDLPRTVRMAWHTVVSSS
jgi:anaerobic magnesium-protoporphyrin IX monomethyl ester cyclase